MDPFILSSPVPGSFRRLLLFIFYVPFFFPFFSCSPGKTDIAYYGSDLQAILLNDDAVFRGTETGMTKAEVKSLEKMSPAEEDRDFLYYEIAIDSTKSFSISYTFEKDTLTEILVDVFPGSNKNAQLLFSDFKLLLDARYGPAVFRNYEFIWDIDKENKSKGKFSLADESSDYGYGKLTLYIYRDPYF